MSDPLIRLLGELPLAEPDPARAERIRLGCRARLARQAPRARDARAFVSRALAFGAGAVPIWEPLLAVLGIVYLADVIVHALQVVQILAFYD